MDFNDALAGAGDFGVYQKLLIFLLVVPSGALCALVYFTQYFIILIPDNYSCKLQVPPDDLLAASNMTLKALRQLALPTDPNRGGDPSRCHMYDVNLTDLLATGVGEANASWAVVPCKDGWDYEFGSLYPTIATELNMVCDQDELSYYVQAFFYAGTSIGSVAFGFIADRYGRKPSIILSYALAWLSGIVSSFMTNLFAFMILRFLVGMCIIPLSEDPYILSLEYIGPRWRTVPIVLWSASYIVFSMVCPWLAYGICNWTYLSIVTSMPLVMVVVLIKFVPESASWLLTRGRHDDAVMYLRRVAHFNKKEIPENIELKIVQVCFMLLIISTVWHQVYTEKSLGCPTKTKSQMVKWGWDSETLSKSNYKHRVTRHKPRDTGTDAADRGHGKFAFHNAISTREFATNSCNKRKGANKKVTFLDLFRTPRIRKHSILMLCAWFITYCCYHTNVYNTSFLGTNVYLSYTLGSLVELPGLLLVLFGLDTLGRRWPMIIVTGVAGIVGVVAILFRNGSHVTILVLSLLMRVCLTAEYDTIMQYSAEVYPTVLRGRGLAFLRFAGTLSLYVSPSIVYLSRVNPTYPMLITGLMSLVLSVLSVFLPETKGQPMPQSLQDGESFGAGQGLLDCPCLADR
ncbi:unnamed protein product [Ixodes persulcatus]